MVEDDEASEKMFCGVVKILEVIPVKTSLVQVGDDIVHVILEAIEKAGLNIEDGDVLLVADKIVATSEGRIVNYDSVKISKKAKKLAEKYSLEPPFVELVLNEADEIYGGVPRALLTLKNNILIANAGIDHKNAPENSACLWSVNPNETAKRIWKALSEKTSKKIGFILIDSHVNPMRVGTVGFALGIAGIRPVKDCRGLPDLYGRPLVITRMNLADDLAASAHLVMGETSERTPLVIIRGAPVEVTDNYDPNDVVIAREDCMFMNTFLKKRKRRDKKLNGTQKQNRA
ncbi:MAG: coenzyme F420-0:L-glutamate ligase [Candidatus Bathyarchaeia archaeon]